MGKPIRVRVPALALVLKGYVYLRIKAIIHPDEEGGFWAEVPALKGCYSEGEGYEETLANIREAAEGWLQVAAE